MATTITGTTIDVGPNKLVANSAGNVGVGTASPETKLTIDSDISTTYSATGYAATLANSMMYLNNTNGGSNTASLINFRTGTGDGLVGFVAGSTNECDFVVATDGGSNGIERLRVSNAGIVTKPYQPAFLAYPTVAQQNIAIGVSTIVLNAERFDQGGDFNTGTSTFTAPVTGKYQFNLNVRIGAMLDTGATYYRTYITTSNQTYYPAIIDPNFTADLNYYHLCFSVLADMDAGDTAYAQVQQSGGGVKTDIDSSPENTNFSGYLVA